MHFTTLFSHWRMGDVANPPFSQIVYHFSTLRRSEPYSGGIGLIKSTVKPFLARGLNKTPISGLCYRTELPKGWCPVTYFHFKFDATRQPDSSCRITCACTPLPQQGSAETGAIPMRWTREYVRSLREQHREVGEKADLSSQRWRCCDCARRE